METDAGSGAAAPARPDDEAATDETAGEARKRGRGRSTAPEEERGGPPGPEPTRYGDWERKGIARDF